VFVNRARNGEHRRQTVRNVEARLVTVVKEADKRLAKVEIEPIGSAPRTRCAAPMRPYGRPCATTPSTSPSSSVTPTPASHSASTRRPRNDAGGCRVSTWQRSTWPSNGRAIGREKAGKAPQSNSWLISQSRAERRIPQYKARIGHRAAVAQLARASACHAEGRGFESHQPLPTTEPN
jgi:hypothetical protein